jgi:two-component system, LytTR family, sensor kinase
MPIVSTLQTAPAGFPQHPAAQKYLGQLPFAIVCWTGVVALESSYVFVFDAAGGNILPAIHYLAWATFNWFALALLTPLIYDLGRRYPITGPNWERYIFFPHAFACLGWLITQALCRGVAGWLYTLTHELPASAPTLAAAWIEDRSMLAFIAYWLIVLMAGFSRLREEARLRELRQAQLETRLASAELEKLRMQIQPHFLFNTLQAAITLIQEDPPAAEDVLLRLSGLLRISLDQMDSNEIPLARELEFLDLYVGIQRRRFGERLSVEIHADPATLGLLVPTLILQPLVENAIRHGIGKHKGEDRIEVFGSQQHGGLQIEVWNSNSVVDETSERLFQRGVGLRNTKARLEHLYGPVASLIFRPLARGGAAAIIFMPARSSPQTEAHAATQAAL